MPAPYSGGCQCGAIRYEIAAEPITVYVCHCTDCQRQASSAFGMSMTVPRDAVTFTRGTPKTFEQVADSGNVKICSFCPDCGTRLFHGSARNPATVNCKAGTLDDTSWLRPVANVWTGSAQPWVIIPDAMLNFASQPEDFGVLVDAWNARD